MFVATNTAKNSDKEKYLYSSTSSVCIRENDKCLKNITNGLKDVCDETINATDRISTNVSTNFQNKKARYKLYCYLLHIAFLVIILLF